MKKLVIALAIVLLIPVSTEAAKGGPGETDTGNNLAVPVIWADNCAVALRGTELTTSLLGEFLTDTLGVSWYLQQDPLNTWQAENLSGGVDVDWIDWGDNLESKDWTANSVVRVEIALKEDLDGDEYPAMIGYEMSWLYGEGTTEMWGSNGLQYTSDVAHVYSCNARLTIQKLTVEPGQPGFVEPTWDAANDRWIGDSIGSPLYNTLVSAENNVSGKIVYGYNWNLRKMAAGAGFYRLTFSLDPNAGTGYALNTTFSSGTAIVPSTEGEVVVTAEPGGGGTAVIDVANQLTYMDVRILANKGRKGSR